MPSSQGVRCTRQARLAMYSHYVQPSQWATVSVPTVANRLRTVGNMFHNLPGMEEPGIVLCHEREYRLLFNSFGLRACQSVPETAALHVMTSLNFGFCLRVRPQKWCATAGSRPLILMQGLGLNCPAIKVNHQNRRRVAGTFSAVSLWRNKSLCYVGRPSGVYRRRLTSRDIVL